MLIVEIIEVVVTSRIVVRAGRFFCPDSAAFTPAFDGCRISLRMPTIQQHGRHLQVPVLTAWFY